jgi:hypothetical protein
MTRKKIILIVAAAGIVIAGGAGAFALWGYTPPPPDPKTAAPEDVTKYLASKQFAKLPMDKKQDYMEKLHRNSGEPPRRRMRSMENLSEKEREQLHENMMPVFMARMRKDIDQYFELPEEQRTAYLDEMIDRDEERRQHWRDRRPPEDNNRNGQNDSRRRGRGRHWGPEHLKRMIENTPPQDRARFMEFRKAMRKRREERGLPERRGPGRR